MPKKLPTRQESEKLLEQYIQSESLRRHCRMVAAAMQAYAQKFNQDQELWYQAGLLHDLAWEKFNDNNHGFKAADELLVDYPDELRAAVRAHAYGYHPDAPKPVTDLEKYLYACDEITGIVYALSLIRPDSFDGMKIKSVKKKIKDRNFAAGVDREGLARSVAMINETLEEHISFLVEVFKKLRF